MSEAPEPIEDLAAGVLNGVMILALGCAFPIAFFYQLVFQWAVGALDLRPGSAEDIPGLVTLSVASLWLMRTGFGVARKNILALLRRRASSAG